MTYSGDPSSSTLDEVRFLLGDTNTAAEKLTDDEVNYLITTWGTPIRAAHAGAMQLASVYAGKMDKSIGQTRISYSMLFNQYVQLAKELARRGGFTSAAMSAAPQSGGVVGGQHADGTPIKLDMDMDWKNYGHGVSVEDLKRHWST